MNVKFALINLISFILVVCFLSQQVLAKKGGSNIVIGGGEFCMRFGVGTNTRGSS